jgi:dienelactone hydrolase
MSHQTALSVERRQRSRAIVTLALLLAGGLVASAQYRTLDDRFAPPAITTRDAWRQRADYLRQHVLASAGLLPLPDRTPLAPVVFGELAHDDYRVAKVYFESLPGFFVTGNLYRPVGAGPFPAILSPHGHWAYGRFENTETASVPGRAINLARQGFVVFTYDAIGYNDSRQLTHTFDGRRERLWGLSLGGLQLWNSIRALDFLETLPDVRRDAIGATGASGGGTQTFLLAAVDPRVQVAAPVNMISLQMQGGCLCENLPGLRLDTTNVEIAATIAPRPLLMVSATGDWTRDTMQSEYPAVRQLYALEDAESRVHALQFQAPHNYNRDSREAVYAWMARWLQHAPADVTRPERSFSPDPLPDLLVFHQRPLPANAVTAAQLSDNWIAAAKRQLAAGNRALFEAALRHALGFASGPTTTAPAGKTGRPTVLLARADPDLERRLRRAGLLVRLIPFTAFDVEAAGKIKHFETYNRTAAAQRVADIVMAARESPGAMLVAGGNDALAGLLAAAVAPLSQSILDAGDFDTSSDDMFLERLYIPGLRRAGDLQTAALMAAGRVVIHDAGSAFTLSGLPIERRKLAADEIVDALVRRHHASSPRSANRRP